MKYIFILILLITTFAYAEITPNEESYLKTKYAVEQLEAQRNAKLNERDGLLRAEDVKSNQVKDSIMATYENQIDIMESSLLEKYEDLKNLINRYAKNI